MVRMTRWYGALILALAVGLTACSQDKDLGVNPTAGSSSSESPNLAALSPDIWKQQVMAAAMSDSQITLLWSAFPGAVSYRIEFTPVGYNMQIHEPNQLELEAGLCGHDLYGLYAGTSYTLQVDALGPNMELLAESDLLHVTTPDDRAKDAIPLAERDE